MAGNPMLDVTGAWIHQQVESQPWWKAYSNTVTTAVGCAITVVAWVASQEWARDDARVQAAVLVLGFIGTVVGVKNTPNGWSASQVQQVQAARAAYITDTACGDAPTPVTRTLAVEPVEDTAPDLAALVAEYNARGE